MDTSSEQAMQQNAYGSYKTNNFGQVVIVAFSLYCSFSIFQYRYFINKNITIYIFLLKMFF